MNAKLKPGQKAPDFQLPAVDGSTLHLADELAQSPATAVMFLCNHCPYVKAYIPRLIQLQEQFATASTTPKARLIAICSNDAQTYPQDNFENMKIAASQWGLNFPYLRDEDQSVAKAYGAERTPEIFVLDAQGVCQYEGGIDDNYQDPAQVTQQPLRDALRAVSQGRPVETPQTYSIGCTIKWQKG